MYKSSKFIDLEGHYKGKWDQNVCVLSVTEYKVQLDCTVVTVYNQITLAENLTYTYYSLGIVNMQIMTRSPGYHFLPA